MKLTHLSLFSGIGGLDLAAEWAGFETVGQCEWADYPTKVLEKHWPDVPRWRDVRTLTSENFYEKTKLRTVDIISGGFPCQPFSVAGKQKGKGDDRYLWPEMLRVIRELTPRWVLGENVPGILRIAAQDIVQDLECEGYDVAVFDIEAAAVGAPHRRERIMVVANRRADTLENACCGGCFRVQDVCQQQRRAKSKRASKTLAYTIHDGCASSEISGSANTGIEKGESRKNTPSESSRLCQCSGRKRFLANTKSAGLQGHNKTSAIAHKKPSERQLGAESWESIQNQWKSEPGVGRVVNGIPNRVDRIKCLGNAVVPQQFYPVFKAIAEIEKANVETWR